MKYRIQIEAKAKKEIFELPEEIVKKVWLALDSLQENPRPIGSKKLSGQEGYRIRRGDYRILYTIDNTSKLIRVYRVGHRREIYR